MKWSAVICAGIALFFPLLLQAQLQPGPAIPQQLARFSNTLDVYAWRYLLGLSGDHSGLGYALAFDLQSSMQESGRSRLWKDNLTGYFQLDKPLAARNTILARMQQTWFQDELSSFNYQRRQSGLTLANRWQPLPFVLVQPELGLRLEQRSGLQERGAYTALTLAVDEVTYNGYRHRFSGWLERVRFQQRENATARIDYVLVREFQPGTVDSIAFYYDFVRRDNFFSDPRLGRVESLRKRSRGLYNVLRYQVSERFDFAMRTRLGLEAVAVEQLRNGSSSGSRKHDDFDISNTLILRWRGDRLGAAFEVDAEEQQVTYDITDSTAFSPFSRPFSGLGYDLIQKRVRLAQRVQYRVSQRDSLRFYFELEKLEYTNTSEISPDTHDEQRWQAAFVHWRRLSPFLQFRWQMIAFLKHFVYIDPSLSARNNWSRLLQLQPVIVFEPGNGIVFQQKAGVRAQYVTYDFDEMLTVRNSYAIREFFIDDSLAVPLNSRIRLLLHYKFEIEEIGSLRWETFSSRPRSLWQNHWFTLNIVRQTQASWRFAAGAIFYQQTRWRYRDGPGGELERDLLGSHVSLGPTLDFSWAGSTGQMVVFSANVQKAFPFSGKSYYIKNIQLSAQWDF